MAPKKTRTYGEILAEAREKAGLTQWQAATKAGYREDDIQRWETNKTKDLKQNRGIPRPLATGQTKKVLDVAAAMGPMMEAMVSVLAYTGIRNSELRGLRWSDYQDGCLRVMGKGSKERVVPVPLPAMETLIRWRGASTSGVWMFPSGRSDDKPLPGQTFNYMFQELRDICCIPEVSGSDILMTQQAAGHASPTTTAIYAKVRPGKLQEAASKVTY